MRRVAVANLPLPSARALRGHSAVDRTRLYFSGGFWRSSGPCDEDAVGRGGYEPRVWWAQGRGCWLCLGRSRGSQVGVAAGCVCVAVRRRDALGV